MFCRSSASSSRQQLQNKKNTKLKIFLSLLACLIVILTILIYHFYAIQSQILLSDGNVTVAKADSNSKQLTIFNLNNIPLFAIALDSEDRLSGNFKDFLSCTSAYSNSHCMTWKKEGSSLTLSAQQFGDQKDADVMHCTKVSWKTGGSHLPKDCLYLSNYSTSPVWFGTHKYILWPSNSNLNMSKNFNESLCTSFIPGGFSPKGACQNEWTNQGGSVIEPLFYTSSGAAVKVSTHHAITVCEELSGKTMKICLEPILDSAHQNQYNDGAGYQLDYMACISESLPSLYRQMMKNFVKPELKTMKNIEKPFSIMVNDGVFFEDRIENNKQNYSISNLMPLVENCELLIQKPLWNFAYHSDEINVGKIDQYFRMLKYIGGTCHFKNITQLYRNFGDFTLQNGKYYTSRNFLTSARKFGLEPMLPITPFVNYDAENFAKGAENDFFISSNDINAPLLISFDYGKQLYPAIIDITSSNASDWFAHNINQFKTAQNLTHFQFYYGQSTWLPHPIYKLTKSLQNVGHFSTLYAELILQVSRCSISDVAYDSQTLNQFVLLSPTKSMRETLASVLAAGLAGYPFVIPNMPCSLREASKVFGPGALQDGIIRWIEMVSFLPVVHIPWDYEVLVDIKMNIPLLINITQTCLNVRNSKDVLPKLKKAFLEAELNGTKPVISPMWMAPQALSSTTPNLEKLMLLEDQFMVGDDMFVAPIVDVGATSRTIFVPPGKWRDVFQHRDTFTDNGKWLQNYEIELKNICVFVRTNAII